MSTFKKTTLAPGDLDPAFAEGGRLVLAFPDMRNTFGESITEGPDGRIYFGGAVGGQGDSPTHALGIACLNKDGSRVTEFGDNGLVILNFAPMQVIHLRQILFLSIGGEPRILLYGFDPVKKQAVIARLHGDGRIDERFGLKGQITVKLPDNAMQNLGLGEGRSETSGNSTSKACAVAGDKIYVVAEMFMPVWQASVAVLIRLNIDGSIDNSFNKVGYVAVTNTHFVRSEIQDILVFGGKITVCGTLQNSGMVARLNEDGSFDTGFAEGGFKLFENAVETFKSIASFNGASVVVTGGSSTPRQGVLAVLTDKGEFDTSFNGGDVLFTSLGSNQQILFMSVAIVVGKIVVSGRTTLSDGTPLFLVARYTLDGALDLDFGRGKGWISIKFDNYYSVANSMAIQNDEHILVVGDEFYYSQAALVARVLNNTDQ